MSTTAKPCLAQRVRPTESRDRAVPDRSRRPHPAEGPAGQAIVLVAPEPRIHALALQRGPELLAQHAVLGDVFVIGTEQLMVAQQEQPPVAGALEIVDVLRLGSMQKAQPPEQEQIAGLSAATGSLYAVSRPMTSHVLPFRWNQLVGRPFTAWRENRWSPSVVWK
jgi:hypothetical protein